MARYSKVVKKKNKKKNRFLPETAHVFLARRIIDSTALILFVLGVSALLSITSYHHSDPSANTASAADSGDIGNWLGVPGAYLSDFLLQTVGLGGLVFGLVFAVWGIRIYKRQSLSPLWLRILVLIGAAFTASVAAARIASGGWLLAPYMGGSIGIVTLQMMVRFVPEIGSLSPYTLLACVAGALSLGATFFALAIRREEMNAFWGFVKHSALTAFDFSVYTATSFIEWVRHYGDPDYELPARPRREKIKKEKPVKAPKIRKEPKVTADEPPFDADQTPAETAPSRIAPPVSSNISVVKPKAAVPTPKKSHQSSFALDDSSEWQLPTIDLLEEPPKESNDEQLDENALRQNAELLKNVLADFNIEGEITSIHPGPVVTLYELEPAPGTKTSRVIGLSDDIARSMSAISVRCSVIPGRSVIGIEIPNARRQTVHFYDMLEQTDIASTKQKLPLILGKDIGGSSVIADLAKMPHLLVAGTTGSGKSVAVNTMILSLIYHHSPEKCRLIMIDPKMLELSVYDGIPHLLTPVVTEPGKAVVALKWAVQEMEERYRAMSKLGVRNIDGYNQRLREAREKGETIMRKVQTGFDPETGKPVYEEQPLDLTELPYIVIFVDEFADLMLVAGKDVENAIQRLAQMARAAGLHLIMATQRPSVDVITGIIKANFPTRISFQVTSKVDSRTILNEGGAEQLLGMGDMLYMPSGGQLKRVHGPFVTDDDVESVVSFLKKQGEPSYIDDVTEGGDFGDSEVMGALFGEGGGSSDVDELYDKAVAIVARERKASTSFIQRHLQIGYNRAARIMEEMEKQGVVSPATSTGKREVLVSDFSDA